MARRMKANGNGIERDVEQENRGARDAMRKYFEFVLLPPPCVCVCVCVRSAHRTGGASIFKLRKMRNMRQPKIAQCFAYESPYALYTRTHSRSHAYNIESRPCRTFVVFGIRRARISAMPY